MEYTPNGVVLIASGCGVAGTLLGVLFTYRFALKLSRVQFDNSIRLAAMTSRKEAAANLRVAFAPHLASVRLKKNESATIVQGVINRGLDSLTIEMEVFRFHIGPESLAAYK